MKNSHPYWYQKIYKKAPNIICKNIIEGINKYRNFDLNRKLIVSFLNLNNVNNKNSTKINANNL